MPYYEREEQLMNIFLQRNTVTMDELAELMFVSKPTLRRDLIKLEQRDLSCEATELHLWSRLLPMH